MKNNFALWGMIFCIILKFCSPADAQTSRNPCFINSNGGCTPVSTSFPLPITPSGTQDVNITQILGAVPSLTNPFWVFPATGATFPISVANLSATLSGMNVNNAATSLALVGTNSVATLLSGTWVGTVTPYVSADGGITYVATQFFNPTTQAFSASATANGTFSIIGTGGMTHAKLVLSPYTSGTVTGNLSATSQAPSDASALYGLAIQTTAPGTDASAMIGAQGAAGMSPVRQFPVATALTEGGVTPVVGGSAASSLVLKASTGNLYSVYAECSAACWLMVFNAVAAPSNGATTAGIASGNMTECIPIAAGGIGSINYAGGPAAIHSVGITATISSTTCATLTLATTGFIHGMVK